MWVVYKKKERKIIGLTADCDGDMSKDAALKEIVEGSVNPGKLDEYNAIQVTDRAKAQDYIAAFPAKLTIAGTAQKPKLSIRDPQVFSLHVTIDAPDKHPVDGIPEITADGTSSALITLKKVDERARPQQRTKDADVLYLRTNHGILRNADGTEDISSITLKKGEAEFRLFSEAVKRVATVEILSTDPNLGDKVFRIEFI